MLVNVPRLIMAKLGRKIYEVPVGFKWLEDGLLEGLWRVRPGTEDIYKIYAESFRGVDHLRRIEEEAQAMVDDTLAV